MSFSHASVISVGAAKVSKPAGPLDRLSLSNGRILLSQLRFLTMSSHSSLHNVRLDNITDLSNTDLRVWLSEFAPLLEALELRHSFPREHHDEEYAVDATIHTMCMLRFAEFEGDVVSTLAIERKRRNTDDNGGHVDDGSIRIDNAPSITEPGLKRALWRTGFEEVTVNGVTVFNGNQTQGEDAIKRAMQRNLAPQSPSKT